jgi:leader peptidase (prepilin peptidase)/N-methyltransferase
MDAMTVIFILYFFVFGLVMGSFFNVVGLRVPKGQSIAHPRSHCTNCNRSLSPRELIPIFSYILQKGRCMNCGYKISPIYPTIEFFTAILFSYSFYKYGWSLELVISLLLVSLLVIIFVSDISYMIIPNRVLLFFAVLFILMRVIYPLDPWWDPILGSIIGFTLLFIIAVVSKGGMGGGDIKLFAVLGIILGWKLVLQAFFFSTLLGALVGIILIASGKVSKKQPIPFGPFIVGGTLLAYFFGNSFFYWYLNF